MDVKKRMVKCRKRRKSMSDWNFTTHDSKN